MTTMLNTLIDEGKTGLFIGGEWQDGSSSIDVIDPATEDLLAAVGAANAVEANQALDAAADSAASWAATAPRQRAEILRKTFELMIEHEEAIAELIVLENGKAFPDALGETRYAAEFFRWFSEEAVRIGGEVRLAPAGDKRIMTMSQPVGISVLITPWNFPAAMATRKLGPALAAGCTTILKPASDTPLTTLAIVHLMQQAGLPAGVVNIMSARGSSDAVDTLLSDSRVRKLSFTGSTAVGRMLLAKAADQVLKTSMELGGNAPFIVFDDADIDDAIAGAMVAKMRNAGEACTAANRIMVHESIAKEFTDKLSSAMSSLKMGPGIDRSTQVGPMVNRKSRDEIAELVELATNDGAKVVTGGTIPDHKGFFYAPTVLNNVKPGDAILKTEIFGPVAPVVTFNTDDEAIAMANDTEYGLISYIYTGDLSRGLRVSEAMESGMVGLNRGLVSDPAAPFGGFKQSGVGREGGFEGIHEFLETKYIAVNW